MNVLCEVHITGVESRLESVKSKIAFSQIQDNAVVIPSALDKSLPLNDHLVWLWGILRLERRFLKNLQQDGARLTCFADCPANGVIIKPNGAEMLHLLNMDLVIRRM